MAMMGNVVVWKPSDKQIYSAKVIMDVLIEAGLPAGVINMVFLMVQKLLNKFRAPRFLWNPFYRFYNRFPKPLETNRRKYS
jgi:hypothetical protein